MFDPENRNINTNLRPIIENSKRKQIIVTWVIIFILIAGVIIFSSWKKQNTSIVMTNLSVNINASMDQTQSNTNQTVNAPSTNSKTSEQDTSAQTKNPDDYDGKKYFNITFDQYCITERERELARLINEYRKTKGLPTIQLSKSLSYVAEIHTIDFLENPPSVGECTMHSWSDKGNWSSCCYTNPIPGPGDAECMLNKPQELTNYQGLGREISIGADITFDAVVLRQPLRQENIGAPQGALNGWKASPKHNEVIVNSGPWNDVTWKAMGVSIYKTNSNVWFGEEIDPAGTPRYCSDQDFMYCDKLTNANLKNECFFEKSEFYKNKNMCDDISDKDFKEDCYHNIILIESGYHECKTIPYATLQRFQCEDRVKSIVCDKLSFNVDRQEKCYYDAAVFKSDPLICNQIKSDANANLLASCFRNIAVNTSNVSFCDLIQRDTMRSTCIREICKILSPSKKAQSEQCNYEDTRKAGDINKCLSILENQVRNGCLLNVARDNQDLHVCDNITDSANKDNCIKLVATDSRDKFACEYIQNKTTKNECIAYVNANL